jgi:hypothetical protein
MTDILLSLLILNVVSLSIELSEIKRILKDKLK